jgi:hypothetical protein
LPEGLREGGPPACQWTGPFAWIPAKFKSGGPVAVRPSTRRVLRGIWHDRRRTDRLPHLTGSNQGGPEVAERGRAIVEVEQVGRVRQGLGFIPCRGPSGAIGQVARASGRAGLAWVEVTSVGDAGPGQIPRSFATVAVSDAWWRECRNLQHYPFWSPPSLAASQAHSFPSLRTGSENGGADPSWKSTSPTLQAALVQPPSTIR